MKINGQNVIVTKDFLIFRLRKPFYSAWQKYRWEKGVEGFGLSKSLVDKAIELKKKIRVQTDRGEFTITTNKILLSLYTYKSSFTTIGGTILYIIPKFDFTHIPIQEPISTYNAFSQMPEKYREEIRAIFKTRNRK